MFPILVKVTHIECWENVHLKSHFLFRQELKRVFLDVVSDSAAAAKSVPVLTHSLSRKKNQRRVTAREYLRHKKIL